MNLSIRSEAESDHVVVADVVGKAFKGDRVVQLVNGLRKSSAWRDLSFVACVNEQVVGHVSFTRGWIDAPTHLIEVLVLSPLSVTPEWQHKGIGSELVTESIKRLADRNEPLVFLEGDPAFYSRLGFLAGQSFGFSSPSVRIPDAAFQLRALPKYEPSVVGRLVYPEIFWEMDCVGLRPNRGLVS